MTERAIAYLRVSTQEQTEGFGLTVQREAIEAYCAGHALELADVLADEGISGAKGLEDRPGLTTALALMEEGDAAVLVVYRLDRLARDLLLQETLLARVQQFGGVILSVTEPDVDSTDPTRVLVRHVLGAIGQYERGLIRARTAAGRAAKRARGGYAGGRPRFGTTALDGSLVNVEAEQGVIEFARQLRAEGMSYRAIREGLEAAGHCSPNGDRWGLATIGNMVSTRGRGSVQIG